MTDLKKQIAAVLEPHFHKSDGMCKCGEWCAAGIGYRKHLAAVIAPLIRTLIEASEEARYREGYSDGQRGNTFPEKPVAGTALARVVEAETKVLREALQAALDHDGDWEEREALMRAAFANSSEPKP